MSRLLTAVRGLFACITVLLGVAVATPSANAAFHLWGINEIYTNNSGSLQFIELRTTSASQNFVNGQQIQVTNIGGTQTHTFVLPGSSLGGTTTNHSLLLATAGAQAAGAPAPDYIIPDGFLFSAGGSISFFGLNGGAYSALPTDGILSRTWTGGGNAVNSPTNYAGQTGTVTPAPSMLGLIAASGCLFARRRRRES